MPNDLSAQTFILSEFLEKKAPHFRLPRLKRKALVHKHCHHDHVMTFDAERSVLKKMGLDFELLDSGCCGMAGSFGFESGHYDVSVAVGERRLLPAVRQTDRRHVDHRRRLQLPRADRRLDRARSAASGPGHSDGAARRAVRAARAAARRTAISHSDCGNRRLRQPSPRSPWAPESWRARAWSGGSDVECATASRHVPGPLVTLELAMQNQKSTGAKTDTQPAKASVHVVDGVNVYAAPQEQRG